MRFEAFSPDVEVLGEVVAAFINCLNCPNITPFLMRHGFLGRHGLRTVDVEQWFPLQQWLNVLNDLVEECPDNASADLLSIGMKMFETYRFPPQFDTLSVEEVLLGWNSIYSAHHRGADIGEFIPKVVEPGYIQITARVPYPDEVHYGLFYAILQHFCPEDVDFTLRYDESMPRRNEGGSVTIYHIQLRERPAVTPPPERDLSDLVIIELPVSLSEAVVNNESITDRPVTFRLNGGNLKALISLRPAFGGSYRTGGAVAMLRLLSEVNPRHHPERRQQPVYALTAEGPSLSSAMRLAIRQAQVAGRGIAPVLLSGEGGVGKSYFARAIHEQGSRRSKPLVEIDCRAIPPDDLVYQILGSGDSMPSKFEIANEGTLVFDQIEALPLEIQQAVLYVIETRQVLRPGHPYLIPVDVRIIAITTRRLEQLVAEGRFIPQLYYRFGVFSISIPPLRERVSEIPYLVQTLLARIASCSGERGPIAVDPEALDILCRYPWPGNIRELETVLESAASQCEERIIRVTDLPQVVREGRVITAPHPQPRPVISLAEAEREAILRAGWACRGNVTEMAGALGIGRTTLWRKLKGLNLDPDYFKR
ncbi:MAG: hypothetical protein Kow00124_00190 [Anaerolineae bacterium]